MTLVFDPLAHVYTHDGEVIPSVTKIIDPISAYYHVPEQRLRAAADRGTAVHLACEHHDKGWDVPDDFPPDHEGYVAAWRAFRADTGFVPDLIEMRVYHPEERYAGTIDRVGMLYGRRSIIDLKTSYRLGPAVGVQLALYALAYNYGRRPRDQATERYAVRVGLDGTYEVREYSDPLDTVCGIALLDLWRWTRTARRGDAAQPEPRLHR